MARMTKDYPFYRASIILHLHNGTTWRHELKDTSKVRRDVMRKARSWAKRALAWPPGAHQYNGTYEVILWAEGAKPIMHATFISDDEIRRRRSREILA